MTPQEESNSPVSMNTPGSGNVNGKIGSIRAASVICLLAAIWLFVSPWVYGAAARGDAWNSWVLGVVIFLLALLRISRPAFSTGISWVNAVLGAWVFCSPWIYGYLGNTGRFINSLCVGFIVFVFALMSGIGATRLAAVSPRH